MESTINLLKNSEIIKLQYSGFSLKNINNLNYLIKIE